MHTKPSEPKEWHEIKGILISRFKTISAVSRRLKCSNNAIRKAVEGKAPRVMERLEKLL